MPKHGRMIAEIVERIDSLSLALLLPLFFALTGLQTYIDLLTGSSMRGHASAIVTTAAMSKLAGAALTASLQRQYGQSSTMVKDAKDPRYILEAVGRLAKLAFSGASDKDARRSAPPSGSLRLPRGRRTDCRNSNLCRQTSFEVGRARFRKACADLATLLQPLLRFG